MTNITHPLNPPSEPAPPLSTGKQSAKDKRKGKKPRMTIPECVHVYHRMFNTGGGKGGGIQSQAPSQLPSQVPSQVPSRRGSVHWNNNGSNDPDAEAVSGGVQGIHPNPSSPSSPLMENYSKHRETGLGLGTGLKQQASGRGRGLAGMSNVARTAVVIEEEMMFEKNLATGNGGHGSATSSISEGIEGGEDGGVEEGMGQVGGGPGMQLPTVQFGHLQHAANRPTAPLPAGPPSSAGGTGLGSGTGTGLGTPTGGGISKGTIWSNTSFSPNHKSFFPETNVTKY